MKNSDFFYKINKFVNRKRVIFSLHFLLAKKQINKKLVILLFSFSKT
jgi:hypothetical protein